MKKGVLLLILVFLLTACTTEKSVEQEKIQISKEVEIMKLTSNDFKQGGAIPKRFTCQGENVNPHLAWADVPAGTKSFALICDDPDAPAGTWVHWLVKNIPANLKEIRQNSVPGDQVENDFGKEDYGGPCPPSGTHRYFFRLYALDIEELEADNKDDFYSQVKEHAIAKAELMGTYKKT